MRRSLVYADDDEKDIYTPNDVPLVFDNSDTVTVAASIDRKYIQKKLKQNQTECLQFIIIIYFIMIA